MPDSQGAVSLEVSHLRRRSRGKKKVALDSAQCYNYENTSKYAAINRRTSTTGTSVFCEAQHPRFCFPFFAVHNNYKRRNMLLAFELKSALFAFPELPSLAR